MDLCSSLISSPEFSVDGSGFADESFSIFDNLYLFSLFSYCVSYHISWPLVCGSCFSCSRETARNPSHHPELYSKHFSWSPYINQQILY